jgi:hypothetical protein
MKAGWLVALAVTGTLLAGCSGAGEPPAADYAEPATLETIPGTTVNKVTLTELAARQLGIETTPVTAAPSRKAETVIPLTALVYGPDGAAWTYANTAPLTYVRQPLVIDRIDGDTVLLRSGPPVGTPVVTVGGQELLGTEYGVGEE